LPVADRGRGGFDSHTFPPACSRARALALVLALALALVLGLAGAAAAQGTDPGEVPPFARPDSAGVTPPPGDTLRPPLEDPRDARGERIRPWHRKPWAIMTRSALVPGWGQWTNQRRLKAVLVAGAEVAAGVQLVDAHNDTQDALDRQEAAIAAGDEAQAALAGAEYDTAFERRATWAWVTATAVALAMLDAYVDAHLLQFDADFGPNPGIDDEDDAESRVGGVPGVKVGLRLAFSGPRGH
jgi:hypothetical protein